MRPGEKTAEQESGGPCVPPRIPEMCSPTRCCARTGAHGERICQALGRFPCGAVTSREWPRRGERRAGYPAGRCAWWLRRVVAHYAALIRSRALRRSAGRTSNASPRHPSGLESLIRVAGGTEQCDQTYRRAPRTLSLSLRRFPSRRGKWDLQPDALLAEPRPAAPSLRK